MFSMVLRDFYNVYFCPQYRMQSDSISDDVDTLLQKRDKRKRRRKELNLLKGRNGIFRVDLGDCSARGTLCQATYWSLFARSP